MQKTILLTLMLFMVMALGGCATTGDGGKPSYNFANGPANLPKSAKVDVLRYTDNGAIIGIRGVIVMHIKIYGRDIETAHWKREGEWITFELPKGRWFNFRFHIPDKDEYAFVYVTREAAEMPPAWMGQDITTYQPQGWGAAMTVRGFVRK